MYYIQRLANYSTTSRRAATIVINYSSSSSNSCCCCKRTRTATPCIITTATTAASTVIPFAVARTTVRKFSNTTTTASSSITTSNNNNNNNKVVSETNTNNNNNNNKVAVLYPNGVFNKIACIGTGMMAQAFIEPMIVGNVQPPEKFTIFDVNVTTIEQVQSIYPTIQIAETITDCVQDADLVICAVKPQNCTESFFYEMYKGSNTNSILLSVIAGKGLQTFQAGGYTKIVRSMPNTPATIGQGMTVWSATDNLTIEEREKIRIVLNSCGKSMYVDDESYIDMATSISGSGPAYIFLLMESMIDAGVHMGFPREKAQTLVYQTMLGSTLYAMESMEHPAILRNRVTSPSGTTASALYELENGRFRTVIKDAMWACYRRSLEMGNHDSNVGPGRVAVRTDPIVHVVERFVDTSASSTSTSTTTTLSSGSSPTTLSSSNSNSN